MSGVYEEVGMKRVLSLSLGVLLLAAPGFVQAAKGAKAEKAAKPAAGKTLSALGKVTAVAADWVTVKGKDAQWTPSADKRTTAVARAARHKMAAMNCDKKPTTATD